MEVVVETTEMDLGKVAVILIGAVVRAAVLAVGVVRLDMDPDQVLFP